MGLPDAAKPFMFKKGQSGNPSGRPKIPEGLRTIASLSQHEVTKLVSKYARMTIRDLFAAAKNQDTPVIELSIIKIFLLSAEHGDQSKLTFLLDRAIGKVPVSEPTTEEEMARIELRDLTNQELIEFVNVKVKELESVK
jgi:hypothetical protein